MAIEIERKFLVSNEGWKAQADRGQRFRQGYLSTDMERTVRVRSQGDRAWLTVKGKTVGAVRAEYEYPVPVADANAMLDELCLRPVLEKTRYHVAHEGLTWEVDVFEGVNLGLVVAEIELPSAEHAFTRPGWVGAEVTSDVRYFNANLVQKPFKDW